MNPYPLSAQGSYQHFMPRQMQSIEESIREGRDLTIEELRKLREAIGALTIAIREQRKDSEYRGESNAEQEERIARQWKEQQGIWNQMAQMHWHSRQESAQLQQEIRLFRGDLQKFLQIVQPDGQRDASLGTEVQ
ncbi:MAG: hypothetical protein OWT28_10980 [Firmicutes bacterium]|nr:hypothetical protein [Bacillota bacterium]